MCLIAWNWQPGSATPLVLIGNRDEFYARPTQPLHWWDDTVAETRILAGRDLQAGGTWLGIAANGRLAALTNVRSPSNPRTDSPSRGELVAGFLQSSSDARVYLQALQARCRDYNPFNLLVYDGQTLAGLHGVNGQIRTMQPGVGAVSNANFETPWPKLVALRRALETRVAQQQLDTEDLLSLLKNREIAADELLPSTGVPLAWERSLSATFIQTPDYGTRASSVIRISAGSAEFTEVRFDATGFLSRTTQTLSSWRRIP